MITPPNAALNVDTNFDGCTSYSSWDNYVDFAYNANAESFIITGQNSTLGLNGSSGFAPLNLCYSVSCNGYDCSYSTILVTVLPNYPSLPSCQEECNLVCYGDFEGLLPFSASYLGQTNTTHFVGIGQDNSYPSISASGTVGNGDYNTFVSTNNFGNEIGVELNQPILPDETVEINFDVAVMGDIYGAEAINIIGFDKPNCEVLTSIPTCTNTNTGCYTGVSFNSVCIEPNFVVPNSISTQPNITYDPVFGSTITWSNNSIQWFHYPKLWKNETNSAIDYIIIVNSSYLQHLLIDNISIKKVELHPTAAAFTAALFDCTVKPNPTHP